MARDGNGTFQRLFSWITDAANEVKIRADRMDDEMDGMAQALTDSIAKDGQTVPTANLPMGTFRHTNVGNATARNQYAALAQVQDGAGLYVATVGGTAGAITLTPSPAITAYAAGQRFSFIAGAANTGAVTVAVSGLSAQALTKYGTTALVGQEILADALVTIEHDGTRFQLLNVHLLYGLKGADIASATTVDLSAATGDYVDITGTTAIESLGTLPAGAEFTLRFADALTLTHDGASLILPGAANITTAAGDVARVRSLGSGNWKCTDYMRASALPVLQTRTINSSGELISGGGDLSANRTFTVSAATQAQMEAASSNAVAVTPLRQAQHLGHIKCVVQLTDLSGTPSITTLFNSLGSLGASRSGTGQYTFTWTASLANPMAFLTLREDANLLGRATKLTGLSATSLAISVRTVGDANTDIQAIYLAVLGDA